MKPRRFRASWLIVPALGLGFGLFFSSWNILRNVVLTPPADTRGIFIESFSRWMVYTALAPLVGILVRWRPLYRGNLSRRLPVHMAAALVFAAVHSVIVGLIYGVLHFFPRGGNLLDAIVRLELLYFALNFVLFWATSCAYHAVSYHHEIVRREQIAASLQAMLVQSRLDGLRSQLNPHFLFNTLNSISSLALTGEREKVAQTLSDLSDLLRVSLDHELPQEIPLDRELGILARYNAILHTRFGDRLTIDLEVDPLTRDALVPSMMLQPLMENAFQHGVAVHPGPGRVVVRAARVGETLSVRVEDSGPGFSASNGKRSGIGLSNTRARLQELYGDRHRLTVGNLPEGGAFVEVTVPFRQASNEGASA